jgi:hypothetical protein
VFHPVDPALEKAASGKPFAKVGADGSFTLTTYEEGDGAPEGQYGITVDWRPAPKNSKQPKLSLGDEGGGGGQSVLNPKYSNPNTPFMTVTIKKGDNPEILIEVD